MIVDRLNSLLQHLQSLGRPVVGLLRPGVTPADLDDADVQQQDVRDWFGWWNGVAEEPGRTQGEISVVPGYWPVSLAEARQMKPSYQGDPGLGDSWIPLLASGGGDMYAAVWKGDERPAVAGVLVGEPTEIEFLTIESMLEVFTDCFARGAYFTGATGNLEVDPSRYDEIYGEIMGDAF